MLQHSLGLNYMFFNEEYVTSIFLLFSKKNIINSGLLVYVGKLWKNQWKISSNSCSLGTNLHNLIFSAKACSTIYFLLNSLKKLKCEFSEKGHNWFSSTHSNMMEVSCEFVLTILFLYIKNLFFIQNVSSSQNSGWAVIYL